MKWFPILFLAAAIATGCGNNVKDLKFSEQGTDNNWRSVFKSAVMSDALSQEEKSLLQAAIMREKQNISPTIPGKTVRQVIDDQREWHKENQK
jgi:hypothetical protein